jgi:ribosomal protein S18 acetylase RimI-like enzyme
MQSAPPKIRNLPDHVSVHKGWSPGLIGWITAQHGLYYSKHWQLGCKFETIVAQELGNLMLRYDANHDLLLSLSKDDEIIASLTTDGSHDCVLEDGARIRFVIVAENWQSRGLGHILMDQAMEFIVQKGFRRAFLTTFKGLDAAKALYESFNFVCTEEQFDSHWGRPLFEQKYRWIKN